MLRIALHAHSIYSYDGRHSLASISRLFGLAGFDAVLLSEHDRGFTDEKYEAYCRACRRVQAARGRAMLVPGIEYSDPDNVVHLVAWGVGRFLGEGRPSLEVCRDVRSEDGLVFFAHPERQDAWRRLTPELASYLDGIEVWNRKTDGFAASARAADAAGRLGLPATYGIDFHRLAHLFPIGVQIETELNESEILSSLGRGDFEPIAFSINSTTYLQSFAARVCSALQAVRQVASHRHGLFRRGLRNPGYGTGRSQQDPHAAGNPASDQSRSAN